MVLLVDNVVNYNSGTISRTASGKVNEIGNSQNNVMQIRKDTGAKTFAHESGHWLGLDHVTPNYYTGDNADRLMRDGNVIQPSSKVVIPEANKVTFPELEKIANEVPNE